MNSQSDFDFGDQIYHIELVIEESYKEYERSPDDDGAGWPSGKWIDRQKVRTLHVCYLRSMGEILSLKDQFMKHAESLSVKKKLGSDSCGREDYEKKVKYQYTKHLFTKPENLKIG